MQIKVIANQNEIYHKQKLLGEGAFGKAYLVRNKQNDEHLVIKEINLDQMSKSQRDQTIKEAQILRNLNHPNIVSLKEFYITKQNKLKMVMQYAECGDISKAIAIRKKTNQHYDEGQVLDWFTQICLAIKHVHDRKILHRDIKGQNVFITKTNTLKLGDFGIARVLNKTVDKARTVVGTPYYLSPEIIENKPYSFKSDIWSMGVLLYELCAFTQPFTANSLQFLALKIVKGSFIPIQNYSKQLKSLIAEMLSLNPDKRPSVNQILKKTVIQNRIRNFLTDSKHVHEFSHTVLHNQKVQIFANKLVQQQQQKQNSRQLNPVQSQINKVQQERKRLKQQGLKIEEKLIQQKKIAQRRRKIQEEKREDERRKYEQDKKIKEKERKKADQQRKKWILHQKQKQEQRDYEERKKSAKIAQMKRKKQQEEYELEKKRQYLMQQKYEYEEDKKKEQDKIKKIKKQLQNQKKTNELNQFARQQYFENLEIRKRAEERARQERDGYSQPQQFSDKIYKAERDHGYPQSRKNSNKNELIDNYHYNSRPLSKNNSREKKSQQLFLEKRNQFSMMENINQNLQNEYKNPNFKGELGVVEEKQFKHPRTSSREIQQNEKKNNYDKERQKIREDREKFKQNKMKEDQYQQQDIATIRGAKWEKKVSSEQNIQEQEKLPQFKQPSPSFEHSTQFQIQDSCKLLINQKQKQNFNEYLVQLEGILDNINKNIQVAELPPSQKPKQSPLMQIPIVEEVIFRDDDDELNFSLTAENKIQSQQKEQQMMQQQVDLDYFSNFSKLQTLKIQLEEIFGTQKFIQLYRIFQKQMADKGLQEFDLCQIIENLGEQFDSKLITQNMSRVMILIVMEEKMNNI